MCALKKEITPEQALKKLETLCMRAEHSQGEMMTKLKGWGISYDQAAEIVRSLVARKFVDDSRFALSYINDKIYLQRWGKRKTALGLRSKGLGREVVEEALAQIDDERYAQGLTSLVKAKLKMAPLLIESYEGRTKLYRWLMSRGYEPDLIAKAIKEAMNKE